MRFPDHYQTNVNFNTRNVFVLMFCLFYILMIKLNYQPINHLILLFLSKGFLAAALYLYFVVKNFCIFNVIYEFGSASKF